MSESTRENQFIVLLGGEVTDLSAIGPLSPGATVIAADSGLHLAAPLGLVVAAVVGDMDSVNPTALAAVEALGTRVIRMSPNKDASDAELALDHALSLGATRITIIAGRSNRLDHELANFAVLFLPALRNRRVEIRVAGSRAFALDATERPVNTNIECAVGDIIGLLPFGGDANGVTTSGLQWSLTDEDLKVNASRGISNRAKRNDVVVSLQRGRLLVTLTKVASHASE